MGILKFMVFPVLLPCDGLVCSVKILGGVGGEQLLVVNLIFSKGQIEYLRRKSFEDLQVFNRKPWEITLHPDCGLLWILGCSLLTIFEFELASPFCLGFTFSPADPGKKDCTTEVSARIYKTWLSSGFGEETTECITHFSEVAFLHQGGIAWTLSREEEGVFLGMPPLDKRVLTHRLIFVKGKFSPWNTCCKLNCWLCRSM